MGMGMGMGMGMEPAQTQLSDPGRALELKKIFSRLLALQNFLSSSVDQGLTVLRDYVLKAIELFRTVIDNLASYKDKIDDIIVLFYSFIERAYEVLKEYYKIKEEQNKKNTITVEAVSRAKSAKDLPKDLLMFLADPKIQLLGVQGNPGNEKLRVVMTPRRIDMLHKENMKFLKAIVAAHEDASKNFDHITSLELYSIYTYRSGDSAWYSFSTGNVHDFNHDLALFNSLTDEPGVTKVVGYKQWMSEVRSEKRLDGWER